MRVAIEAGIRFGWDRWLFGEGGKREKSGFIGMHGFGASAPADRLYEEFGITAEAAAAKVKALLGCSAVPWARWPAAAVILLRPCATS